MPRKGKEPAGLRRWRLAHRKKGSHRSARSAGKSESHAPGFAATYQHGKTAVQILSPITDQGLRVLEGSASPKSALAQLGANVQGPAYRGGYFRGAFVGILDAWGSRKFRTTNAMAQKSITALAPEVYALGVSAFDQNFDPHDTHSDFVQRTTGFDPSGGSFHANRIKTYATLKYGGVVVRKIATAIPAVGQPLRKALNMVGLTL